MFTRWWMTMVMSGVLASACRSAQVPGDHSGVPQAESTRAAAETSETTPPPQPPPAVDAPASAPAPASQRTDAVHAFLDKLERSADDLKSFTAELTYSKHDPVWERQEIRTGSIIYQVVAKKGAGGAEPGQENGAAAPQTPAKRFSITFDKLFIKTDAAKPEGQPGRVHNVRKHFIFDGGWLVEIDHDQKQFIKRRIVAPGKAFDPLKLGEGPFPIPVGQAKQDVLSKFDVQLIDPPAAGALAGLKNVQGVRLLPRPGTPEAKDYRLVDIFYDRDTFLPVGIETLSAQLLAPEDPESRERRTVVLRQAQRNPELTAEQLQKLDIIEPANPKEWAIQIEPWRGPE